MKAILVVDVEEYGDYYVDVYRKDASDRFEGRYYLKPMPKKKEAYAESYTERADEFSCKKHPLYAQGWNECIEVIEK